MLTGTTTTQTYECGACHASFPTLDEVFSHPCDTVEAAMGGRAHTRVETHRGDSVDAPERRESTGRPPAPRQAMTNRYPGNCARCGGRVEAGQGVAVKNHAGGRGASWAVEHLVSECPAIGAHTAPTPEPARPVVDTPDVTTAPAPAGRPVTEKQATFIRTLATDRESGITDADAVLAIMADLPDPRAAASKLIDGLLALPRRTAPAPAPEPAAPAYEPEKGDVHVLDGDFYRVHKAQGTGRFYAVRWDGDEWVYAGGALRRCSTETLATAEDAARFGELFHACVFCTRPLDTPESTAVGYGPVCATKRGLPWG
jgi:hypothetical protein